MPPSAHQGLRSECRHKLKRRLKQCFSTCGSRPTFGSPVLTFWWQKPVLELYYSIILVAKLCFILFCGQPLPNVENHWFKMSTQTQTSFRTSVKVDVRMTNGFVGATTLTFRRSLTTKLADKKSSICYSVLNQNNKITRSSGANLIKEYLS